MLGHDHPTHQGVRPDGLYFKGAYVLHALRQEIGDRAFGIFLKGLQDNFQWKFLCALDLIDMLKAITQKDYRDFFEKYYWGVEMPPRRL